MERGVSGFLIFILMFSIFIAGTHAYSITGKAVLANATLDESASKAISFQQTSNSVLGKQIALPPGIDSLVKSVFKIQVNISLNYLIVLLALFIIFFLIIQRIALFVPLFHDAKSWLFALIVTLLISITGSVKSAADFLFGFGGAFKALGEWAILQLIFIIVLLAIVFYAISIFLKYALDKFKEAAAEQAGYELATAGIRRDIRNYRKRN